MRGVEDLANAGFEEARDDRDDSPVEVCGLCRLLIHPSESGVRHFGLFRAHAEARCIALLCERNGELQRELDGYKRAERDMNEALNRGDGSYRP